MTHAIAIILGRAGSAGLPGKNALELDGRPMVAHSVEAARAAHSVDRVIVSTDGSDIAEAARRAGAEVIDRPGELATATAAVADAARHAYVTSGVDHDVVVILYANVPIRPAGLIDRAIETLESTGADSVQSYAPVGKHHPAWMVRLDADGHVGLLDDTPTDRRQDLPELFLPDGGVIAVRASCLLDSAGQHAHAFFGRDRRGIVNEGGAVIDIDEPDDLARARARLAETHT